MEHPLINDISDLTLEELQEKITALNKNLTFAYRMGNPSIIYQIQMLLESYNVRYREKTDDLFKKQKIDSKIEINK